jgi:hypothetical protein
MTLSLRGMIFGVNVKSQFAILMPASPSNSSESVNTSTQLSFLFVDLTVSTPVTVAGTLKTHLVEVV